MANKPTPVRFISKEPVRISFPKFFTKDQLSDSYSCFFLIPKTDKATLTALTGALAEARAEGARTVWGQEIPNASSTIYDGDKPKAQGGEWPEDYKGCMILKASSQYPTQVFDEKKQPIKADSPEAAQKVYGGAWGYPIIDFSPVEYMGKKSVKAYLTGFMFHHDGEAIGGGAGNVAAALADIDVGATLDVSAEDDPLAAMLG